MADPVSRGVFSPLPKHWGGRKISLVSNPSAAANQLHQLTLPVLAWSLRALSMCGVVVPGRGQW